MSLMCEGFLSNRKIKLKSVGYIVVFFVIIFISNTRTQLFNDCKKHNVINVSFCSSCSFCSLDLSPCFFCKVLSVESKVKSDFTSPSAPGKPAFHYSLCSNTYTVFWPFSFDAESMVVGYELQEKKNKSFAWRTVNDNVSAVLSCHSVINRKIGQYCYRVRAKNVVGLWSEWSLVSKKISVNYPDKIITRVSNFPNPVNPKKKSTTITYFLNQDAEMTVNIHDLMGYEIKKWYFKSGEKGGGRGVNNIIWDCKDNNGNRIFKGCYICRIKAVFDKKTTIATRRIGIVY
ncbi:hypothetical protein KAU39_00770 [bacterium]|nr:hypothetical protein [bacterium]